MPLIDMLQDVTSVEATQYLVIAEGWPHPISSIHGSPSTQQQTRHVRVSVLSSKVQGGLSFLQQQPQRQGGIWSVLRP
jgi:hypothetical protein